MELYIIKIPTDIFTRKKHLRGTTTSTLDRIRRTVLGKPLLKKPVNAFCSCGDKL